MCVCVDKCRYLRARHSLDPRNPYNPYNLQVVPRVLAPPDDYFTLSLKGVTHMYNGDAEFTKWEEWKHHFYVFHHIKQVRRLLSSVGHLRLTPRLAAVALCRCTSSAPTVNGASWPASTGSFASATWLLRR